MPFSDCFRAEGTASGGMGRGVPQKNVYTSEKVCYNNSYHAVVGGSHGITRRSAARAARFSGRLPAFKQLTHTSAGRSRRYGAGCKLRSVCGFALPKYGAGPEKHPFVRHAGCEALTQSCEAALGCICKRPTHPGSGPFHAAPRRFSLKYVSIPAKKRLAQRKNSSLPVTLRVFRYTLAVFYNSVI